MGRIGIGELIVILVLALLIFGPAKLPEIGKAVGRGMREFRNAAKGLDPDVEETAAKAEDNNGA
ncbi:MAG: twin-arginine translocase TatA/TatE family subunit [Bacillota bacterium]|nr:twin-arginine translocase TatA/TatE family subunit [Bacillota bacterium]